MSYDVSIGDYDGNYTSNLAKLFHKHIKRDDKTGLQALNMLRGEEAAPILLIAWGTIHNEHIELMSTRPYITRIDKMHGAHETIGSPEICAEYDPANGWGSLVGALIFLGQITAACGAYPKQHISVDY